METLIAHAVSVIELAELDTFVIVFAEESDGSGGRLEIQRALQFDEHDREQGMDTYCLCTSWGTTHYGGVVSWSLSDRRLTLRLDAAAQRVLELNEQVTIELDLNTSCHLELLEGLRRALDDQPIVG